MTAGKGLLLASFLTMSAGAAAAQAPTEPVRLDIHGDPLPPGAIARLGTVRFRASDEAEALAFAADGKTVAVMSRGGLFLFDADSGKRRKRLADRMFSDRRDGNRLAFSPDGTRLAAWGQVTFQDDKDKRQSKNVIRVWEWAGEQKPRDYDTKHLLTLAWSPDGEPLAVCLEKGAVTLHELAAGRSRRFECPTLRRPELFYHVHCACAPAGRTLAVADEQDVVHVWDTATGTKRCTVGPIKDARVWGLALSSDGRHLASLASDPLAVHIWDAMSGDALRTTATDHKNISTLAFAADGKTLATAGWSGIRFWDVVTGKELSRSQGAGSNTDKIAFSGNGRTLATLQPHSGAFHLWDVATGNRKEEPVGHFSRPHGSSFSPDGNRFASGGSLDGTIHVWDLATSKSLLTIHRGEWVRDVAFSRDGRSLYSAWTGDELWISDAATGERQHVIKLEDPDRSETIQSAISMRQSADGKTLVALSYYYAKKGGGGPQYDETLLTGWDPATRKQLFRRRFPGMEHNAVSADARLLAAPYPPSRRLEPDGGGGRSVRVEVLASGEPLMDFPILEGQTWPLAFAPDGRLLAARKYNYRLRKEGDPTRTGSNVILWELATGAEVCSIQTDGQSQAAFSRDGRLLAFPAPMEAISVWDLARGGELRRLQGFDGEITWLTFTPDGRRLISGHADSTLLVWDLKLPAPAPEKLDSAALAKAWDDLAGSDAPRAFRARWALVNAPATALPFLAKHLQATRPADSKRLQHLLSALDNSEFAERSAAMSELEGLGDQAAGALQQALINPPSLELRRRVETLLTKLRGPIVEPQMRRAVRAVAVLEDIGNSAAQKQLTTLAQGAPAARLTQEAKAALVRLANR